MNWRDTVSGTPAGQVLLSATTPRSSPGTRVTAVDAPETKAPEWSYTVSPPLVLPATLMP